MNPTIRENILKINAAIEKAALTSEHRPEQIRLVAVSKSQPAETVSEAVEAGATIIGENYIQEARIKFEAITDANIEWHFIGRLQSNKAKYAVGMFDLIHTVDSARLAIELNKQAAKIGKVQDILVQVNISGEATKAGTTTTETTELVQQISRLKNLRLKGFMTMPPFFDDPENARPYFRALRELRDNITRQGIIDYDLKELSMGMTGDFEAAIAEGATLVRIGTAIFGARR